MPIELQSVTFESQDPQRDAEFWGAILERPLENDAGGILLAGGHGQVGLRFVIGAAHGATMNRLHLHLTELQLPAASYAPTNSSAAAASSAVGSAFVGRSIR